MKKCLAFIRCSNEPLACTLVWAEASKVSPARQGLRTDPKPSTLVGASYPAKCQSSSFNTTTASPW